MGVGGEGWGWCHLGGSAVTAGAWTPPSLHGLCLCACPRAAVGLLCVALTVRLAPVGVILGVFQDGRAGQPRLGSAVLAAGGGPAWLALLAVLGAAQVSGSAGCGVGSTA